MPSAQPLKFTQLVNAPPAEAFRAFTHATCLRDWLCDAAQTDPRAGGRLYLWWADGYAVAGVYARFEPGKRLTLAWHSPQEPAATQVDVTFKARGEATLVTVTHTGLGGGPKWRATLQSLKRAWPASLENLGSVLTTGVDLRQARRPRLGVFFGDFNAEIARQLGVPTAKGVRLAGTAEGSGARAAGLLKDDVLVALNGKPLTDFDSFGPALHGLQAGDQPKVVFYRGAKKHTTPLELSRFPIPEAPATGAALAHQVRGLQAKLDAAIARSVAGLTEAQAGFRPAVNEWSANELIAHFILCERDYQGWVADMLNDVVVEDWLQMRPNVLPRVRALAARLKTTRALRTELKLAEAETAALLEALPADFIQRRPHLYRRAALWALEIVAGHWDSEHAEQMRLTVEAAQRA